MEYFIDTIETIPSGQGFKLLGPFHLCWVGLAILTFVIVSLYYRNLDDVKALKFRKTIAWLIVVDELWKDFWLFVGGRFLVTYLPFHLCSIQIIFILILFFSSSFSVMISLPFFLPNSLNKSRSFKFFSSNVLEAYSFTLSNITLSFLNFSYTLAFTKQPKPSFYFDT